MTADTIADASRVLDDCRNAYEIADEEAFGRFKVDDPRNGLRVWWYYTLDEEYAAEWGEGATARDMAPYSGLLVLAPDRDTGRQFDVEDFVVVVDTYPTEKCSPDSDWVALPRLLVGEDLVEVFAKDQKGRCRWCGGSKP